MTYKEERLNHQRKLSATEKLIKVQELKAQGKTQAEVAEALSISRRTVCSYWNSTETISKQEANRKKNQQDVVVKLTPKHKPAHSDHKPAQMRQKAIVTKEEQHDLRFLAFKSIGDT